MAELCRCQGIHSTIYLIYGHSLKGANKAKTFRKASPRFSDRCESLEIIVILDPEASLGKAAELAGVPVGQIMTEASKTSLPLGAC